MIKMSVGSQKSCLSNQQAATGEARAITIVAHKIDSLELFSGTREIIIVHGDDSYRLRLTSQNKLILTK
jgi:hemin uptake protein HemP